MELPEEEQCVEVPSAISVLVFYVSFTQYICLRALFGIIILGCLLIWVPAFSKHPMSVQISNCLFLLLRLKELAGESKYDVIPGSGGIHQVTGNGSLDSGEAVKHLKLHCLKEMLVLGCLSFHICVVVIICRFELLV
ncbi:hypothetical protein ILYODFUR_035324 [Ilyodon furcidens]|uniref:Uncharacterized protein n=1 Tax=Ilyodon furcidens TaxID=33524 RepID=A0ABV0TPI7_9TELE